jgi:hypothetical protein
MASGRASAPKALCTSAAHDTFWRVGISLPSEQGGIRPSHEDHVVTLSAIMTPDFYHGDSCRLSSGVVMMHSP